VIVDAVAGNRVSAATGGFADDCGPLQVLQVYVNFSAPEKIRLAVSTNTGLPPTRFPGTSVVVQNSSVCLLFDYRDR
jgi:hypothetical protein